jgi:hypothetical protein
MDNLESVGEFKEACQEIHLLLEYSKKNTKNVKRYATFNKAAIVLLCAKFEAFFETFLAEYAFYHISVSSNHSIDRYLYNHMVDCIVNHLETYKGKQDKRKEIVAKLEKLCGANEIRPVIGYHIDPKLKFGKHGQGEIERLLKTFGFADYAVLDSVKSFFIGFNSLNSIRNNIIHEDATPSLTHQDVKDYLDSVVTFIDGLVDIAIAKMKVAV